MVCCNFDIMLFFKILYIFLSSTIYIKRKVTCIFYIAHTIIKLKHRYFFKIKQMLRSNSYYKNIQLRDYSSAFSRSAFSDIIKYDDFAHFDWLYSQYSDSFKNGISYFNFLKTIYSIISKEYRCEYVYKNELVAHLIKLYGTKNTVAYSEFHVGNSIVDIALFNGESKAFEIKTEYDTPRRLEKQLCDYKKVFDKCYLVLPADNIDIYASLIDKSVGIITLTRDNNNIVFSTYRDAEKNDMFDVETIMSCLRIKEYESIVTKWCGHLPDVPQYRMFQECLSVFSNIPMQKLKEYFLTEMKNRNNNISTIKKTPGFLRQICLSMNLSNKEINNLLTKLESQTIS